METRLMTTRARTTRATGTDGSTRRSGTARPSRRAASKARVRGDLLAAARRLFAARGVTTTTMDDIAKAAMVSRATAFNYFPSKTLLLEALTHEMEDRFMGHIEKMIATPATAAERIAQLFQWTAQSIESVPRLHRVLIGASEATYGLTKESGVRTARMHRAFASILEAGRRDGNVRRDIPTETLAEIVGGTYVGILHAWRVASKYPLRRRMAEATAALGELVSARDGAAGGQ
jgi:AcrR family transcriptional regulator